MSQTTQSWEEFFPEEAAAYAAGTYDKPGFWNPAKPHIPAKELQPQKTDQLTYFVDDETGKETAEPNFSRAIDGYGYHKAVDPVDQAERGAIADSLLHLADCPAICAVCGTNLIGRCKNPDEPRATLVIHDKDRETPRAIVFCFRCGLLRHEVPPQMNEEQARVLELRSQNHTEQEIAELTGIHKSKVHRLLVKKTTRKAARTPTRDSGTGRIGEPKRTARD